VGSKTTGRPGYAPVDLLKLYIHGYLNRVRSSRRLEAETHRNIEVIWLLRHLCQAPICFSVLKARNRVRYCLKLL
jgi:transposase